MTDTPDLETLKATQQRTWSSGDYGKVAWLTVPLADVLCDAIDVRPGATVLDVATGTGHVALATARRFCRSTGIDYVPELLEVAEARAAAEGLEVDFRTADAESLPFEAASFDDVMSAIGVMFTADHQRAARELVRVCKPGGRIGLASWTPNGFVGQLLKTVGKHAPPPRGAQPPTRWGSEDYLSQLLADGTTDLALSTATVTQRFVSPEQFADFFLTHYGPTLKASERLSDEGKRALRSDLVTLAHASTRTTDGTFVNEWEYLIAVATRA